MHTCREIEKLLDAYTDGELDEPRRLWLEAHLQECALCNWLVLGKKNEARLIRSGDPVPALSTGFTGRVMSNLARSNSRAPGEGFFSLSRLGVRPWLAPALAGLVLLLVTVSWAASGYLLPTSPGHVAARQYAPMAGQAGRALPQTPVSSGNDNLAPPDNLPAFGVHEKSAVGENAQGPASSKGVAGKETAGPEDSRATSSPQENSVAAPENPNPANNTMAASGAPATAIPAPLTKSYQELEQQGYTVFWPGYLPPGYSLSAISAQPPQLGGSAAQSATTSSGQDSTQNATMLSGTGSLQFSYRDAQTGGWITLEIQPLNTPNTPVPQLGPAANAAAGNQPPGPPAPAKTAGNQPSGANPIIWYAQKHGASFMLTVTGSLPYEELEQVAASVQ
jgi:hypothetical protein